MFQRALIEGPDGPVLAPTKTRRPHQVALDPDTHRLLEARHEQILGTPLERPDAFVFSSDPDASRPWRPNWVTKKFIDTRRSAGISQFRLHDLRHFMATQMLNAGIPIPIPIVSARLAHARTSTTLDVYAHAIPGGDHHAARAIASILARG